MRDHEPPYQTTADATSSSPSGVRPDPEKLTAPNRSGGRLPPSELVHEERW